MGLTLTVEICLSQSHKLGKDMKDISKAQYNIQYTLNMMCVCVQCDNIDLQLGGLVGVVSGGLCWAAGGTWLAKRRLLQCVCVCVRVFTVSDWGWQQPLCGWLACRFSRPVLGTLIWINYSSVSMGTSSRASPTLCPFTCFSSDPLMSPPSVYLLPSPLFLPLWPPDWNVLFLYSSSFRVFRPQSPNITLNTNSVRS